MFHTTDAGLRLWHVMERWNQCHIGSSWQCRASVSDRRQANRWQLCDYLSSLSGHKLESKSSSLSIKQLNVNIDFIGGCVCNRAMQRMQQQMSCSNSHWHINILYLLRKPVFAAVINNLEVSPSMQTFKSSQLAAWLSPALAVSHKSLNIASAPGHSTVGLLLQ